MTRLLLAGIALASLVVLAWRYAGDAGDRGGPAARAQGSGDLARAPAEPLAQATPRAHAEPPPERLEAPAADGDLEQDRRAAAPRGALASEPAEDVVRVRVVDAERGAPLAGATVGVVPARVEGRTDAAGEVALRVPRSSEPFLDVRVTRIGRAPARARWWRGEDPPTVPLAAGARLEGRLRAPDGSALAGALVGLHASVAVRDAHGEAAPDQRVARAARGDESAWIRTAEDGGFAFRDVVPDVELLLEARPLDGGPPLWRALALAPGERRFLALDVGPGARVHGVVRRDDGTPIAGLDLHLCFGPPPRAQGFHRHAITDAEGRYAIAGAQPGTWTLYPLLDGAWGPGERPTTFHVIPGLTEVEVDVTLAVPPPIRGRVIDPDGAPVGGARVVGFGRACGVRASAVSADDGAFVLDLYCAGGAEVEVDRLPPGLAAPAPVRVGLGDAGVLLRLERRAEGDDPTRGDAR